MQQEYRTQGQGQRGDLGAEAIEAVAEPQAAKIDAGGAAVAAQVAGAILEEGRKNTLLDKGDSLTIMAAHLPHRCR
ncbi:hypothetical protein [Janthinobacterium sp. ROICE36]|uniref:hypothetical protein n=1 Tax=Janthinobacterium sp. ROICE36 TaxID=2048670 RepID=UPI002155DC55|nr:hypothetical protein [Janthinobacterium sp. ROICE36]